MALRTQTPPKAPHGYIEAKRVEAATGLAISYEPAQRSRLHQRLASAWGNGNQPEWDVGCNRCKVCAMPYEMQPVTIEGFGVVPDNVCPDCLPLVEEHYAGSGATPEETSPTPKWDRACPPRFAEAILRAPGELPATVDRAKFERVTAWRPTERRGMVIIGPSGAGKSLAFWALARVLESEGVPPVVLSAVEFGRILSSAARDIQGVDWLCSCRVLMVDDLGKEKASPAVGALLWELLDKRYGAGLPFIATTRFNGDQMEQRFGEAFLGEDIRRRINETCSGVVFRLGNAEAGAQLAEDRQPSN